MMYSSDDQEQLLTELDELEKELDRLEAMRAFWAALKARTAAGIKTLTEQRRLTVYLS